eukprot:g2907.t1
MQSGKVAPNFDGRSGKGDIGVAKKDYVVCISGTFNPPHNAHVRMGMDAARKLRRAGRGTIDVKAVVWIPVHDNYLWNKLDARDIDGNDNKSCFCMPMQERVKTLKLLIEDEASAVKESLNLEVLPFEDSKSDLLESSPTYGMKKRKNGYLKTLSTANMIRAFKREWVQRRYGSRTRLGLVFGIDNLSYMPTWNKPEAIFDTCDLVLVNRPDNCIASSSVAQSIETPGAKDEALPVFGTPCGHSRCMVTPCAPTQAETLK